MERDVELNWKDKRTDVPRVALPFQTVEIINQPRAPAGYAARFDTEIKTEWRNKLIWGDNKYVLASLLNEYAGKINLIYIDPPFATGTGGFTYNIRVRDEKVTKEPSIIEGIAYTDTWGRGYASYLQMMYDRLVLMRDLLTENGSIYVHMDWHAGHYVKLLLDEIFGRENFRNEIKVKRTAKHTAMQFERVKSLQVAADSIFVYAKSAATVFNKPYKEASERQKAGSWHGFSDNCYRPTMRYKLFGLLPPSLKGRWLWEKARAEKAVENYKLFEEALSEGRVNSFEEFAYNNPNMEFVRYNNGSPQYWIPAREQIMSDTNWADIQAYAHLFNFPTEKSELLLERIINMGSNPGELVFDCFVGSGTTLAVAEKLGRRWIGCDMSRYPILVTRKRLMSIPNCKPFEIVNIGKYERQYWQQTDISGKDRQQTPYEYFNFINQLYGAETIAEMMNIHGRKGKRYVHIGFVDAPVTFEEIKAAITECKAVKGTHLDILGWEWQMGLKEQIENISKSEGLSISLYQIPDRIIRDRVKDPKLAQEIQFFELGTVRLDVKQSNRNVSITITDFMIPNIEDIPGGEAFEKIKKWTDYIDFWAVDWEYKEGEPFHNQWQSFRTRKEPKLQLISETHHYERTGKYKILVKVIDIFGNDTSKIVEVNIK